MSRELDRRDFAYSRSTPDRETQLHSLAAEISDRLPGKQQVHIRQFDPATGNPRTLTAENAPAEKGNYVQRALEHVRAVGGALGLAAAQAPEFQPDPVVQRTSGDAAVVHLQQKYKGIPVFDAAQAVQFDADGAIRGTAGAAITIPGDLPVTPVLTAADAVLKAAQHVAVPHPDEQDAKDQFGEPIHYTEVDLAGFTPKVIATFTDQPDIPSVLEAGPFGDEFKAGLIWFPLTETDVRLAWDVLVTMPNYEAQYRTIVDAADSEILYCHQKVNDVFARGNVFRADGGTARQMTDFPRPLTDHVVPVPPGLPAGFPDTWVEADQTVGNSTNAHEGDSGSPLAGTVQDGVLTFNPRRQFGIDQRVLNIFYYNCFMHDFAYLLGFNEAAGNFQRDNFGRGGRAGDRVDARAHPGQVPGTASMATPVDGSSPVMNMGLVTSTNRHTALDSSVVFHEFTHGITNRLVGGPGNSNALAAPQSKGMGEGWSDYIACVNNNMSTVVGAFVLNNPAGIRGFRYDANFPDTFSHIGSGRYNEVHNIGEVWCATLMEMTRRIGTNPAVQIVIDALKLSPANPSFLDMRDAMFQAALDLKNAGRITARQHFVVRRHMADVFSLFHMGPRAVSNGAQLTGIVGDFESHFEDAATHSGFLVQGRFGVASREPGAPLRGNFELVTPFALGGLAHYFRDNDDDAGGFPWRGPATFGSRDVVEAVSLIQSNFSSSGTGAGNLELVARVGDRLEFYFRDDAAPFAWHGPFAVPGAGSGLAGTPALIQSRFGARGNFEMVVPRAGGGLAHFVRNNDGGGFPWSGPFPFGAADPVEAVCLLQSTLSSSGTGPGNLELIARVGDRLDFYFRDDAPPFAWHGPFAIPGAVGVSGNPALVQSRFGQQGNFEVVAPLAAGGLAHFFRNNDVAGFPWNGPVRFGAPDRVESVALIQSDFSAPGNLEVIAKVGHRLLFYFRDSGPAFAWSGRVSIGFAALVVPNIVAQPLSVARLTLTRAGLRVGRVRAILPEPGPGRLGPPEVVEQDPPAGTVVTRGSRVDITVESIRLGVPALPMTAQAGGAE